MPQYGFVHCLNSNSGDGLPSSGGVPVSFVRVGSSLCQCRECCSTLIFAIQPKVEVVPIPCLSFLNPRILEGCISEKQLSRHLSHLELYKCAGLEIIWKAAGCGEATGLPSILSGLLIKRYQNVKPLLIEVAAEILLHKLEKLAVGNLDKINYVALKGEGWSDFCK